MKQIRLCIFLNFFSLILNAQNVLTGVVLSGTDNKPVVAAAVYINGTTIGSSTDSQGHFTINDLSFPCQLVVSHVAYDLKILSMEETTPSPITIRLKEKENQLVEVAVAGSSRRSQNINEFKNTFLGNDKFGKKAILKNEDALLFERQTDTVVQKVNKTDFRTQNNNNNRLVSNGELSQDSSLYLNYINIFNARTKAPLIVELPLLGYTAYIDLVNFTLKKDNNGLTIRNYRAFTRFVSQPTVSENRKAKLKKNRQQAYYNSAKHFCKSMFNDELKVNGYLISFKNFNDSTKHTKRHYFDINTYIKRTNKGTVEIIGLKNKKIDITFFSYNNKPTDLSIYKSTSDFPNNIWKDWNYDDNSYVIFQSDTCIINYNGTIPDNNIMFGGKMATKCGGALLPNDYLPEENQNSINTNLLTIPKLSAYSNDSLVESSNSIDASLNDYLHDESEDSTANKLSTFAKHFSIFSKTYPQEKTYLHFDNTTYYLGETIWFKAYVVQAGQNTLSKLSKTLYVELITPEGNILETKKLKIENGQCYSDFLLKDSLLGGFYEVRAYTRYMLNQGKDYVFSRVFAVYDKPKKDGDFSIQKMWQRPYSQRVPSNRKEQEQNNELTVTFFPEGGNLVRNIESKVAFKAVGKNGENITISGAIYNESDSSVAELNTTFLGMGEFSFIPGNGKYIAKVQYNNQLYTFDLPEVLPSGYVLTVDNTCNDNVNIIIEKSPTISKELLGISISCRGTLYGFEKINIGAENILKLSFAQKTLPTGVSQISLFNASGEVLCERILFINHGSDIKIDVTQDKKNYAPFDKINLEFSIHDLKNEAIETTFSLAVKDATTSTYNPYNDNILTNLLLSSELKGYIENPAYYFESNTPARKAALDLLLLTQGWTRYVWKQMAGVVPYEGKQPIEDGLMVEGKVLSLIDKKPKSNIDVLFLLIYGNLVQHDTRTTDEDGRFYFPVVDFNGKSKLTLRTKDEGKRKEYNIILDRNFSPKVKSYAYQETAAPTSIKQNQPDSTDILPDSVERTANASKEELTMDKKSHLLKEVTVKEKHKYKKEGEGLRNANIVYDVEKTMDEIIDKGENEPSTILDYIYHLNSYFNFEISTDNNLIKGLYKGKGVVFCINNNSLIDDSITFDKKPLCKYSQLMNLSINEIQTITISENEGTSLIYNPKGNGNEVVVFIYTNKNHIDRTSPTGIRQTSMFGYTLSKEFYNTQYDKVMLPEEKDYRRTLYWNPNVKTDTNGKAKISFFNNSSCKNMNISAETVNGNGEIGILNRKVKNVVDSE